MKVKVKVKNVEAGMHGNKVYGATVAWCFGVSSQLYLRNGTEIKETKQSRYPPPNKFKKRRIKDNSREEGCGRILSRVYALMCGGTHTFTH